MDEVTDVAETTAAAVADGLEIVSEQAEDAAQFVRNLSEIKLQYALIGAVAGGAAAAFVAYRIAYKRASLKFEELAEAEISQMKEHFQARELIREEDRTKKSLEETVQELGYTPYGGERPEEPSNVVPPTVPRPDPQTRIPYSEAEQAAINQTAGKEERNIFSPGNLPDWDYSVEQAAREGKKVYVIHVDERFETDADAVQALFYEGDGVLTNERDEILDINQVLGGLENLRFGEGSGDANIVFIRNEHIGVEFEVVRDDASYAEHVHGIKHSDEPRSRRRSRDWDG